MQVPPASRHADDVAMLARLAQADHARDPGPVRLDGTRPAYLVRHGPADLVAVPRHTDVPGPDARRVVATVDDGAVVPSSTALGAWQLALTPRDGTLVRPLLAVRLRELGFGAVAEPEDDPPIPAPRSIPAQVAALARGMDATLCALAATLRCGPPPPGSVIIRPGEILSLEPGTAVCGDGGVSWVRVAGGHARRNDEQDAVFGGAEPALLAGCDWIAVESPATIEAVRTVDLLVAGQLPAALDLHLVGLLRSIDRRFS